MVEKWIFWIPPINERSKLNFDDSKIQNRSASGWVIRDSNGIIKMDANRHLGNTSIIITECIAIRDGVLATKNNDF